MGCSLWFCGVLSIAIAIAMVVVGENNDVDTSISTPRCNIAAVPKFLRIGGWIMIAISAVHLGCEQYCSNDEELSSACCVVFGY